MINKLINLLNGQRTAFKLLNLYEENNTDYILVSVASLLVAVEVCYGDEISFMKISSAGENLAWAIN